MYKLTIKMRKIGHLGVFDECKINICLGFLSCKHRKVDYIAQKVTLVVKACLEEILGSKNFFSLESVKLRNEYRIRTIQLDKGYVKLGQWKIVTHRKMIVI